MTDRRTTIKLIMAAAAAMSALQARANYRDNLEPGASVPGELRQFEPTMQGYGPDPDLIKTYEKGECLPVTISAQHRHLAAAPDQAGAAAARGARDGDPPDEQLLGDAQRAGARAPR